MLSNSQFTTFVEHGVELDSEKYVNGTDQEHSPLEESPAARAAWLVKIPWTDLGNIASAVATAGYPKT